MENKKRSITLLYNNSNVNNTITLNNAFTNYDEIEILVHRGTGMTNHFMSYRFSKEVLNELIGSILFFAVGGTSQFCQYKVTNTNTFTLDQNQNATCIAKVYGIKY